MVVIDAEKHNLNWRGSAEQNGIRALKEKYQGNPRGGAVTLISNSGANAKVAVNTRKPRPYKDGGPIDKETGRKVFVDKEERYVNAKGETVSRKERVAKLELVDDLADYSSGTPMERIYVEHGNNLKALANEARKQMVRTPPLKYSPSAKKTYAPEVVSLNAKLDLAFRNRPLERQAMIIGNTVIKAKKAANPNLDDETLKKISNQALMAARNRTGARKSRIDITPLEWEAIQAGAISDSKLKTILDNTDMDKIKELATPRTKILMTPSKRNRAQSMLDAGATRAEVASALGVSVSTLDATLYGDGGA
jgi:hypothetical protein